MNFKKSFSIVALPLIMLACKKNDVVVPQDYSTSKILLNASYASSSEQKMDIYLPANRSSATTKVIIAIHGGGWSGGDKSDFTQFVDTMRRRLPDYAIFNLNYRLATGTNLFPTQENDVKSAIQFILDHSGEYGISQKFVLMGASAGAHLALLQGYKYSSQINPKAIISFFGPTDLIDMYRHPTNSFVPSGLVAVIGKTPEQDSLLYANSSPINFVKGSSSPTILLHGGADPLVSPNQSASLKTKLTAAGVVNQYVFYPTEAHGWFGTNLYDSFNKIEAFIRTNVN